jgi:hypothetical protein
MLVELNYDPVTGMIATKQNVHICTTIANDPQIIALSIEDKYESTETVKSSLYTVSELVELKKAGFNADEIVTMQRGNHE